MGKMNAHLAISYKVAVLVIQALKTLGKTNVTSKTIQTLSSRLNEDDKAAMLREAAESTDWVYNAIRQIAGEVQ
jgi:hypothetical protein